ncbi:hypothetical protein A6763_00915 [Aeromonas caviae]|nr:hypothetical protein A6763_00915 [Aeromonas caviae]
MILGVHQYQGDRDLALPLIRLDQPGLHRVGGVGRLGGLPQQVVRLGKLPQLGAAQRLVAQAA